MSIRTPILAAAAVVAMIANLAAVTPALSQPLESVELSYQDLNLASAAGRNVLDRRIAGAAAQLCGQARAIELSWNAAVQTCRTETIALTQPQRDAAVRYGTVQIASSDQIVRVSRAAN
jgi:UrcA family protein